MRKSGFSLIELVVVISIVGILLTVAIPITNYFAQHFALDSSARLVASDLRKEQRLSSLEHTERSYDPTKAALPGGITLLAAKIIKFSASGFPSFGGVGTITLQNRFGEVKKVVVSSVGRVRIE
jgi:prepilin-type N-terminal cleavage/methylation domain-containing protein